MIVKTKSMNVCFGDNIPSRKQLKQIDPGIHKTNIDLDCINEYINKTKKSIKSIVIHYKQFILAELIEVLIILLLKSEYYIKTIIKKAMCVAHVKKHLNIKIKIKKSFYVITNVKML